MGGWALVMGRLSLLLHCFPKLNHNASLGIFSPRQSQNQLDMSLHR